MAYTCNLSTLGGWGRWITWGQEFKTSLANMVKPLPYRITKISQEWWQVHVIPATLVAEAWESLESRRLRLQWAETVPLCSSLGSRVRHTPFLTNFTVQIPHTDTHHSQHTHLPQTHTTQSADSTHNPQGTYLKHTPLITQKLHHTHLTETQSMHHKILHTHTRQTNHVDTPQSPYTLSKM